MINVTKTYLPDIDKYKKYIDSIYENGWVTNNGPLVKELENRLEEYLGVKNVVLVSNGTIALEIAYKALSLTDQVITTPFSFVATTSSLVSNGLTPIFTDIDSESLNIDVNKIESSITSLTSGIVPVHVFGNSCEVECIDEIAKKNNLKVIYDAAHAFGVKYKGRSLLNYGDISTLSFHATKVFHTIEGGALIVNDDSLVEKIRYLINFGIKNKESIPALGTNAKMNEFEAAMGLCVLDDIDEIISNRNRIIKKYEQAFSYKFLLQKKNEYIDSYHSYFPIIFDSEKDLKKVEKKMNELNIFPRRYFYPSLNTLRYINPRQVSEISEDISKRILCLPVFYDLDKKEQDLIIDLVLEVLK